MTRVTPTARPVGRMEAAVPLTAAQREQRTRRATDPKPAGRVAPYDWRDEAACRGEDPDLFQPIGNTGPALLQIEDAKAVCRRCPVEAVCLDWALSVPVEHGVLGGASEDERKGMKRREARQRQKAAQS